MTKPVTNVMKDSPSMRPKTSVLYVSRTVIDVKSPTSVPTAPKDSSSMSLETPVLAATWKTVWNVQKPTTAKTATKASK